jgi:uncharacterized Tic20 family protein
MENKTLNRKTEISEPYVGPRPFEEKDGEIFFGREQETSELASLIIAHPIVLLYSQSGAGKTSLLKASLIPLLKSRKAEVFTPARVKGQDLIKLGSSAISNIYVYNALKYLSDNSMDAGEQEKMSLADFLPTRTNRDKRVVVPLRVMIFDQFEELFTAYPERYQERQEFFEQVDKVLRHDTLLRVVFAMREDFIAELDPYVQILPEKLQTRYRLLRLNEEAARIAIEKPLEKVNLSKSIKYVFDLEATDKIVENLRTINVMEAGNERQIVVPYIEPVHLQVICQSLWRKLESSFAKRIKAGAREVRVTINDVVEFGNLGEALREFYDDSIQIGINAIDQDKRQATTERIELKLRKWFDEALITSEGTRSIIFGNEIDRSVSGIPILVIRELEKQRLIRAELRSGKIWYELSHDRFIKPIKDSNEKWFQQQALTQLKNIQKSTSALEKEIVLFDNNNRATILSPSLNHRPDEIVKLLDVNNYKSVILVVNDYTEDGEKLFPKQAQIFGMGIARAAIEANAIIIDNGVAAGVITNIGDGVATMGNKSALIGIAPQALVQYPGSKSASGIPLEQNHSHFILVEGNSWGSETNTTIKLTSELASPMESQYAGKSVPSVLLLIGGGDSSKKKVLVAVRQNISILIVEGSGGIADQISEAWNQNSTVINDPVLSEIITDGNIRFVQNGVSAKGVERLIVQMLGVDKVLMQAWETFASYDLNTNLQQKRFNKNQITIILLGVVITFLVIFQQVFAPRDQGGNLRRISYYSSDELWHILYFILTLLSIALLVCMMAANRFRQGNKWLLLRAGAEAIKREIFCYRARVMNYRYNAESQLARKVETITRRIMRTEVNVSGLVRYNKENVFPQYFFASGDDGFRFLKINDYIEVRLEDQLHFFQSRSLRLERQISFIYWTTYIVGGTGVFLAAVGQQAWIALTTAIVTAFSTYLVNQRTENTLIKYNQTATDLTNIKAWWNSLSAEEQSMQINIDSLVAHTEEILQGELDGWVQRLQNPLAELRPDQEHLSKKEEYYEFEDPKKSVSEVKVETSWKKPDEDYDSSTA